MSNHKSNPSRDSVEACFVRLGDALQRAELPTETQGLRSGVSASEFMFMNFTRVGLIRFKHIDTRNYLLLTPNNIILVPLGGPFLKGFFDKVRP